MIPTQFLAANPLRNRLVAGEVQLWRIDLTERPAGLSDADLAEDERVRFARLLDARWRAWRSNCRLALRQLLGGLMDLPPARIELDTGDNGRPLLAGEQAKAGVNFNVTHAGPVAVIALADAPRLGVDIERVRRIDLLGVARRMYHESEQRWLRSLDGAARETLFFRIWTAKEALLKAEGSGIFHDPADWRLLQGEPLQVARNPNPERDGAGWRLTEFLPQPGVFGSLAMGTRDGLSDWKLRPLQMEPELTEPTET